MFSDGYLGAVVCGHTSPTIRTTNGVSSDKPIKWVLLSAWYFQLLSDYLLLSYLAKEHEHAFVLTHATVQSLHLKIAHIALSCHYAQITSVAIAAFTHQLSRGGNNS